MRPAGLVVVSLVGETPWLETTIHVDPGRRYDWGFMRGLPAAIVVRPDVDAIPTIRAVFEESLPFGAGYPWLVDIERQQLSSVVDVSPLKLWPTSRGGHYWRGWFECN